MKKFMFGGAAAALVLAWPLAAMAQTTPTTPPATPMAPSMQMPATPTTPAAPATYTDAQLRSFASASTEIDPISRSITASSTAEQRTQASTQIRGILQRNNLDSSTYNAIATQAHNDTAFAGRIRSLSGPAHAPG